MMSYWRDTLGELEGDFGAVVVLCRSSYIIYSHICVN